MIGHLRAFGHSASQGRIMLPWSILAANGVGEEEIFSGTPSEGVVEALGQVSELALEHLDKARAAIRQIPANLRPAFAQIAVLDAQLKLYLQAPGGPFAPAPDEADWRKITRLTWWTWRNR